MSRSTVVLTLLVILLAWASGLAAQGTLSQIQYFTSPRSFAWMYKLPGSFGNSCGLACRNDAYSITHFFACPDTLEFYRDSLAQITIGSCGLQDSSGFLVLISSLQEIIIYSSIV